MYFLLVVYFFSAIFLSQFKNMPHSEIVKNILELNEKIFTFQQIKDLMNFITNANDVQAINDHLVASGDSSKLAPAELFSLAVSAILLPVTKNIDFKNSIFRIKASVF
jgi:hypothetical protein